MMQQAFASPGEALEHYGVKGMHWGVRSKAETEGARTTLAKETAATNTSTKAYILASQKLSQPVSKQQAKKNLEEHQTKFAEKFVPSNADGQTHKLTPTQKKLLIGAAVGVGAVGTLYVVKKYSVNTGGITKAVKPGAKLSAEEFNFFRVQSQNNALMGKGLYVTKESFARPAFELPAGHTFHRISAGVESGFDHSTYSLSSLEDVNRYLVGFQGGTAHYTGGLHHVTWKSTKPIKVPALKEVLDTVRDVLVEEHKVSPHSISHEEILETYGKWSGGGWKEGTGYGGGRKVLDTLRKKGYGAIVDEADAGIVGEKPLVFFGRSSVGPKSSKPISVTQVKTAREHLTEMHYRK